jgi:hypothetical protein
MNVAIWVSVVLGVIVAGFLLSRWWRKFRWNCNGRGISILVPFHCPDENNRRSVNWRWLKKYWECHLPGAEIVVGDDSFAGPDVPFSKSAAVNDAASRATGDIFVIVDADGYIDIDSVIHCAKSIREAKKKGQRLWYVPYRQFYRLTDEASQKVLNSDPRNPYGFSTPPNPKDVQDTSGSQLGHWYGAMIQIMSSEAFWEVGGWDERFRGWGGEDHAAMRATDTLYWRHKTMPVQVLHLWHPMISPDGTSNWVHWHERVWANQTESGANDKLSGRYYGAYGDVKRMRALVDEGRIVI